MNMLGDEPPYLSVGTEVSAKYKGAFCEAKVRKVDRVVKCKVAFKLGFGSHTVLDNQIKGVLRVNASVEARHPEKKELVEGTITKIQDCSQYTVVFDDGDITTLRRSALCLKSGRHFAESETLDQLPLTHPEHFGNPVVGGRRGGRRRLGDESSGDEETPRKGRPKEEREAEIGKVVCVDLGDKKKVKDNWFPGLVVAPNAQDTVRIRVKEEYLVRSFKDGRYYTVPKKEAAEFTREIGSKVDNNTLKTAVEKALTFLDKDELPPHWDRELLFGLLDSDGSDSDAALDSDSSDDEPREEKDHFVAQLYKFMDDRGTPINSCPSVCSRDLDLYKLFKVVNKMNGYNRVSNQNQWKIVSTKLGLGNSPGIVTQVKHAYKRFLHSFEDFYRKLGCTMVNHPRGSRARNRGGRSLIRDKDRSTPLCIKQSETSTIPKRDEEKLIVVEESAVAPPEVKKIPPPKEDEVKIKTKIPEEVKPKEEKESIPTDETERQRPVSSLRKKFPTLKASPRTKDEPVVVKKRLDVRQPSVRLKRAGRDNSVDDTKVSDDDASRTLQRTPSARSKRPVRDNSLEDNRQSDDEPSRSSNRPPSVRPKRSARDNSVDEAHGSDDDSQRSVKLEEQASKSTTRSKAKEEVKVVKKDNTEPKRGKTTKSNEGESNKRMKTSEEGKKSTEVDKKSKKLTTEECANKRSRKRRNTDTTTDEPRSRPCLPRTKSVFVGDVLKVYYGSPSDPNGIYEAKVVDIEEDDAGQQMFLVHYAGWNSRYDEWVKRNKIAENLSWTARRAKASSPVKGPKANTVKRKMLTGKAEHARSTTPSSITSSSSRTKSPATPASAGNRRSTRRDRPPTGVTPRRTRRLSGHTDASLDSGSDSGSESDDSNSDNEIKTEKADAGVGDDRKKEIKKIENKPVVKRRPRKKSVEEPLPEVVEKKKPRLAVTPVIKCTKESETLSDSMKIKEDEIPELEVKIEPSEVESPKGRDFDLNEIRSELKGIDKAVKLSTEPVIREAAVSESEVEVGEVFSLDNKTGDLDVRLDNKAKEIEVIVERAEEVVVRFDPNITEGVKPEIVIVKEEKDPVVTVIEEIPILCEEKISTDIKDDIYEFKEPEPFEFQEVLRPIRMFDDIVERSPEKSIAIKKVNVASSPMRATFERKELISLDNEVKSRFRKTIGKKMREAAPIEKKIGDSEAKTEEDCLPVREAPRLEAEGPPLLVPAPPDDAEFEFDDDPVGPPQPPHKLSPEPPCLIPVNETSPCNPPEHSPVLTREDPPRLDSDISSSDSESDERLVIAHDDESTWSDPRPDPQPSIVEDKKDVKRNILAEVRIKKNEDVVNSPAELQKESQDSNMVIKSSPPAVIPPLIVEEEIEKEEEKPEPDDGECSMRSLVCDEVIPGSPAPKDPGEEAAYREHGEVPFRPPPASGSNAAVVMDNTPPTTPPTTPESNISSPREDRVGSSSLDNESSKSHRESPEVELENEGVRNRPAKYGKRNEKELPESPSKKKRRSRKRSESTSDACKRGPGRGSTTRTHKHRDSDSDDTSENSLGIHATDPLINNRSPRPSKYNFSKEMAPDLDANQRIAFLQHQISEIRKAYMHLKSQLASIDRRRKKLRRKDREERAEKAAAAAAVAASTASTCVKAPEDACS